jgi:LDH2 family malate/lactate/ureidoglycolate dehydrogenase
MDRIEASACCAFITSILERLGAETSRAARWAALLVETSLLGFDTHGIRMLDRYVRHIQEGGIDLSAEPVTLEDNGACVRLDGQAGLGHLAADEATSIAIERAKQHGISCVILRNCNHVGACGIYARRAGAEGCIGICSAVSRAGIAPWGGKQALLGVNALAVGAPIGGRPDFLIDMAISRTAMGKVTKAADLGQSIPAGWALDADGNPTTDPDRARYGTLIPIGEHKGYGLLMVVEMLAVLLGGGKLAYQATSWILNPEQPMGSSFMTTAINIPSFTEPDEFQGRFRDWVELLTNSPLRDGFDRIYYPGEIEAENYQERSKMGIPIDSHTQEMLRQLAKRFGVDGARLIAGRV